MKSNEHINDNAEYVSAVTRLNEWRNAYYNGGAALALDSEYDALYRAVLIYEAANPDQVSPLSPSHFVGAAVIEGGFERAQHRSPMLSLRDAFDEEEITAFDRNLKQGDVEYICEAKYDGASLNLLYSDHSLVQAITRGDGTFGEDITQTIKSGAVRGIPDVLPFDLPAQCEIRGEVMMTFSEFAAQNARRAAKGEELYANPRNLASGSLRQIDPNEVSRRGLFFVPYQLLGGEGLATQAQIASLFDAPCFVKGAGRLVVRGASGLLEAYRHFNALRGSLPFALDGMVAKVNDLALQQRLGSARRHPHWAIAAKFEPDAAVTVVMDIEIGVGKNGAHTPVAVLEPVSLQGSTVQRATLNNFQHLKGLDVRIGDTVSIVKSGDIIPMLTSVFPDRRMGSETAVDTPTHCVCCGSELQRSILDDGSESAVIYCMSDSCDDRRARYIEYISGRSVLDLRIGSKTAAALVAHFASADIFDLLSLNASDFESLPGFGKKSARNLYDSVQGTVGRVTLDKLIVLLTSRLPGRGIGIGRSLSKTLVDSLGDDAINPAMVRSFELAGTAQKCFTDLADLLEEKRDEIQSMLVWLKPIMPSHVSKEKAVKETSMSQTGKLQGQRIVLTGKMQRTRSQYEKLLEQYGAVCESRVSGDTTLLLTAEDNATSSKAKSAAKKGILVRQVDAFMAENGIAFDNDAA